MFRTIATVSKKSNQEQRLGDEEGSPIEDCANELQILRYGGVA
jgi:hypothetical protein